MDKKAKTEANTETNIETKSENRKASLSRHSNSLMRRLIIMGAGGHGKVAADCAQQLNRYHTIAFLDDAYEHASRLNQWDILGHSRLFPAMVDDQTDFFVAIGNNKIRQKVIAQLHDQQAPLVNLIHPSAAIGQNVRLNTGTLVCANAVINIDTVIGVGGIVNTGATVDHDCVIEDYVHIAPGTHIAGGVRIGKGSFLGIGSSVIPEITMGQYCVLGAGSTLIHHVPDYQIWVGSPAKVIKSAAS